MTELQSILRELFPSSEMASYLADRPLWREQVRDAIAYAPVPLERKRDMFLSLASGKDTAYFHRQAGLIERAVREMRPKPGEFFYLKSLRYFEDQSEEKGLEPYLAWEHIFGRIQEFLGYLEGDERELAWFEAEKWSPDGTGKLKNDYDYTVLGGEVCYFWHNAPHSLDRYEFSTYRDLNLPVPFHAGDIVTADCRPFVPVSHAVILEAGDNRDCCCFQALYRDDDDTWETGAVKHGHIFPNLHSPGFSPLYRLVSFQGQLPEEERLLEKVSRYVSGDEERGSAVWNYIFQLSDNKRERTVTESQIRSYIESDTNIRFP